MATLKERADRGIDRAIQLLIDEGYVKGHYALPAETARAYGFRVPETACGTKRCLIGALEAGFSPRNTVTDWCSSIHDARVILCSPALRRAYAALNVAALRHTRTETGPRDFGGYESPAEGYSERDTTTRRQVVELLRKAKRYTGEKTHMLEAELEAVRNG